MILNINEVSKIKKEINYQGGCCGFYSYVFKFYNQNYEELGTATIPTEEIAIQKEEGILPFDMRKITKSHKENFVNWVNKYEWCLTEKELEELKEKEKEEIKNSKSVELLRSDFKFIAPNGEEHYVKNVNLGLITYPKNFGDAINKLHFSNAKKSPTRNEDYNKYDKVEVLMYNYSTDELIESKTFYKSIELDKYGGLPTDIYQILPCKINSKGKLTILNCYELNYSSCCVKPNSLYGISAVEYLKEKIKKLKTQKSRIRNLLKKNNITLSQDEEFGFILENEQATQIIESVKVYL